MNRSLSVALIASLCLTLTASADDKLPPAAKQIIDKAIVAVTRNLAEFTKANKEPLKEARKALEELSTKLIKDGKSMEAQAVLKKVDTLHADVLKAVNAPTPTPTPDPAPVPDPVPANVMAELRAMRERRATAVQSLCASKWIHMNKWTYAFSPDGRYVLQDTPRKGTYSLSEDAKAIILRWDGEPRVDVLVVGEQPGSWMAGDGMPFRPLANGRP